MFQFISGIELVFPRPIYPTLPYVDLPYTAQLEDAQHELCFFVFFDTFLFNFQEQALFSFLLP